MQINPSATFDILYIASATKPSYHDLSLYELNYLSYFACLLSLYDGKPAMEWEYSFYKNDNGVPISSDLAEAVYYLACRGKIREESRYFSILPEGETELEFFKSFHLFKKRIKYLAAACDCLLTDSIVSLSSTLSLDPVIKESVSHNRKTLNSDDNGSLVTLHAQFDIIQRIVGMQKELFVPAYIWINYLKIINNDSGRTSC
jgi:hypothetical protein